MPLADLAGRVLDLEAEEGLGLVDGVLAVGVAGAQGFVDDVEGGGGGELVWGGS
jgi:hypothetical protein